ncbi:MAG: CCA tRNA nucleotidyltransferase [Clostridia bacterium]|nr:CCA tRNA nucleotidyltransferase [Clostridia bacterium]
MIINIPKDVNRIITSLRQSGAKAYAVGGAVRDSILGREINDWDVTTDFTADKVKEIFSDYRTVDTGIKHGTVTVIIDREPVEVTTFRIDGGYSDNRHPDTVTFTPRLEDDLERRDFTVNALAYNDSEGLIDLHGGLEDLKNGIIRCIGDPDRRFNEDGLRILRALRFASQLGFVIEENTAKSIVKNFALLGNISAERISKELFGLLGSQGAAKTIKEFPQVFSGILPELAPTFENSIDTAVQSLQKCDNIAEHRLAALIVIAGRTGDETLLKLKLSNDTQKRIKNLVECASIRLDALNETAFLKKLGSLGKDASLDALSFLTSLYGTDRSVIEKAEKVFESGKCITVNQLAVNGKDITAFTGVTGKAVGDTLNALLDMVIENKTQNEKTALLNAAQTLDIRRNGND